MTYTQENTRGDITTYDANGEAVKDSFIIQSSQSLDQVMNEVNRSSVGVSVFYDEFSKKMSFTRTETGKFNEIGNEIEFGENDFFSTALGSSIDTANIQSAQNATFTINGLEGTESTE